MTNRKGMYFTLMTIAFLFIFIFVFMIPGYKLFGERMMATEMRIDSMNDFIKDLERDTERGLYISSYRALMSMEEYIINEGMFLDDVELTFREAVLNGTVNNATTTLMAASTFPDWVQNIKAKSSKLNIGANITINSVGICQTDPWYVAVNANLTFFIRDMAGIASWRINKVITAQVSIIGFEDPLYIVYGLGRLTNLINITPFEGNYTYKINETWYVTNLLSHLENSYYASNQNAPSFLMRFENNLNSSPSGIESLANLIKLNAVGLPINSGSSVVDYHYWNDDPNGDYSVDYMPTWFKLDAGHLAKYEVSGISRPLE